MTFIICGITLIGLQQADKNKIKRPDILYCASVENCDTEEYEVFRVLNEAGILQEIKRMSNLNTNIKVNSTYYYWYNNTGLFVCNKIMLIN